MMETLFIISLASCMWKVGTTESLPTLVTRMKEMAYTKGLVLFLKLCQHSETKEHPLAGTEFQNMRGTEMVSGMSEPRWLVLDSTDEWRMIKN